MPGTETGPLTPGHRQSQLTSRPLPEYDEHRTALADPSGQPTRVGVEDAGRRAYHHDVDRLDQRCNDLEPARAREGDQREPVEIDAKSRCGLGAEGGNTDHPAPRSRLGRTDEGGKGKRGRSFDGITRPSTQPATGQQLGEGGDGRQPGLPRSCADYRHETAY